MNDDPNLPRPGGNEAERRAAQRLNRIEEIRETDRLARDGHTSAEIARLMSTTQTRVRRMRRLLELRGDAVTVSPEEIIVRAVVSRSDRRVLVEDLKVFPYTLGKHAPFPLEGKTHGTWDDVIDARFEGWLSRDEFEEIRASALPPKRRLASDPQWSAPMRC